jgi:hypothetical protein
VGFVINTTRHVQELMETPADEFVSVKTVQAASVVLTFVMRPSEPIVR